MVVACLFAAEPLFVVRFGEVCKAFLGEMEPGELVCCEDKSLENCVNPLKALAGGNDDDSFREHPSRGVMPEGEVSLGVVGDIEIG